MADKGRSRREFLAATGGASALLAGVGGATAAPAAGATPSELGDLTSASASALAQAIRAKRISSVELVEAHLRRIEQVNPRLNAVVVLAADSARAAAKQADAALARKQFKGPLHGVPITIKDSFDTAGLVSTGGTLGRAKYVPTEDATPVARLRAAGAIILGKTNTPELTDSFETDNLVYGRTNNPYDLNRTSGGSSGGAAAIVAVGGSPLDLGSDSGGSIRLPAHFCGIAGIRPTSGRVSRAGHIVSFDGLVQAYTTLGPMARYVEDLILTLPLIVGPDGRDPFVVPVPLGDPAAVDVKRLRVAFHTDNGLVTPTAEIMATVKRAADALAALGCRLLEARPEGLDEAIAAMDGLWVADGGAWLRRLLERAGTKEISPQVAWDLKEEKALPVAKLTDLVERQDRARGRMLSLWSKADVMLCPVNASPALPHGATLTECCSLFTYTEAYNVSGWPGAVVRCGTSPEGLPIGVQVVAPPWREDVALAVAKQLETTFGGWKPSPLFPATGA